MRPSFLLFSAIGLALMGYYWWSGWTAEEESLLLANQPGAIRGCADTTQDVQCPEALHECLKLEVLPTGVCSKGCAGVKDCPEHWCCVSAPSLKQKMCAPPTVCIRSEIK